MKVVILAGGKGTRLKPFTDVVPKPMLPYRGKPILEHVVNYLKSYGFTDIIISLGHLGYQIKNHFGDGSKFGVKIEYSEEKKALGTAGCLNLIKDKLKDTFLLYGGDNITDLDLKEFVDSHKKSSGILTVALFEFSEKSKWGIYELGKDDSIKKFTEKPVISQLVGSMIFCLEPEIFKYIPDSGQVNITDHVLPELLKNKEKVFGFPFRGKWIDIGNLEDYKRISNKS